MAMFEYSGAMRSGDSPSTASRIEFFRDDWRAGELTFAAGEKFTDLELVYQRPVGEARAEGTVELRGVRMVEAR